MRPCAGALAHSRLVTLHKCTLKHDDVWNCGSGSTSSSTSGEKEQCMQASGAMTHQRGTQCRADESSREAQ